MPSKKVAFYNDQGEKLAGKLEVPADNQVIAYAILAHVFTGNKNISATRYISRCLMQHGIAVLRFDFTGLGDSEGNFEDTNFSSNVSDLLAAANFLQDEYESPKLLVGHSLGGAAVIYAAQQIDTVVAVSTIGAPSEPEHVTHLLSKEIDNINQHGEATVDIGGRKFKIKKQFLDDLATKNMSEVIKDLKKPILVLHSPQDAVVEIKNAAEIYHAAFHPKSFISLDGANHMLTEKSDAHYVGDMVASWLVRYIHIDEETEFKTKSKVAARLGDIGYTTEIKAGRHSLLADESDVANGEDFGPSPYQLLGSSLAACKAMTMQMYARRKQWKLEDVTVHVDYRKETPTDDHSGLYFDCQVELEGDLDEKQRARILQVGDKCPVHKALSGSVSIISQEISVEQA